MTKQTWLTLREAADVIGKRRLGETWSLERIAEDEVLYKAIRRELYDMFQSNQVETYAHYHGHTYRLDMENFCHPTFGLNVIKDVADVERIPSPGVKLKISKADLKKYLSQEPPESPAAVISVTQLHTMLGHKYSNQQLLNLERDGKIAKRIPGKKNQLRVWPRDEMIASIKILRGETGGS